MGAAVAKAQLGLQFAADNKDFATIGIKWTDFSQLLLPDLLTDARDNPRDPADLASLVATFRQQSGLPADFTPSRTVVARLLKRNGGPDVAVNKACLAKLLQEQPGMACEPCVKEFLAAMTNAAR